MPKTKYLSRSDILEADDLQIEDVKAPEWGGTLRVRGLTGAERDLYQISLMESPGKSVVINMQNATAKLISLCVIDDAGQLLFTEADIHALGRKSSKPMNRVHSVAQRLSGLSAEDIEELTQNLGIGQKRDSILS